jgi:polar amino acid transport system substrate-binding protein
VKKEKMMKKAMLFLLVGISVFFGFRETSAEKITMGYFEIKPHMYKTEGLQPKGASIAYFEDMASKMGYRVEWKGPLPFPRLIEYLKNGEVDGSLVFTKNKEREQYLYYSEPPYYSVQSVFAVKKANKLDKITSADDVKGYKVGFLKKAYQTRFLTDHMDQFTMEYIHGTEWVKQNLYKLIRGRIDAAYDLNPWTMQFEAILLKIDDQIKILTLPEPPRGIYAVFSKKSEKGKGLLESYNKIFQDVRLDYVSLIKKEFDSLVPENED